ncbi:MAG: polysaccharide biosynthesis/export family protein [Roseiarcus sp.]|jgi:protein involved in polysaccharide export with SLBB domain
MKLMFVRRKAYPRSRMGPLGRVLPLAVLIAGCSPGANMVDDRALEARLDYQSAFPSQAPLGFAPTPPGRYLRPDTTSFVLGPDDIVNISVVNQPDLERTQPVRPDGKIAFFPAGDLQAAGRTVEQLRDAIVSRLRAKSGRPYQLGIQDVIQIKVYGHQDLDTTQTIGPDGAISILPGGSIHAAGKTVNELADEITRRISSIVQNPILNVSVQEYKSHPLFIADPLVNVMIEEINSRRISVLGAVKTPGVIKLRTPTTIMDAISQAGGLSDEADLRDSIVLEDGRILPVSLEKLFKQGDLRQNIYLRPYSSVYVGSSRYNYAYVIGEVQHAGKVNWDGNLSIMDAVSQVGGITQNAKTDHVLVISGGVVAPSLKLVDMGGFLYRGELQDNILLRRGDIVYVPKNDLGTAERYFDFAVRAMGPVVSAESAIVLGGSAVNTLQGKGTTVGTSINLNTQ